MDVEEGADRREAHPHQATEALFAGYAGKFLELNLVDRGRSLQHGSPLAGGMKIRLAPIETRHEMILRPLVTMVASLANRVRELEAKLGIEYVAESVSEGSAEKGGADPEAAEGEREAGS